MYEVHQPKQHDGGADVIATDFSTFAEAQAWIERNPDTHAFLPFVANEDGEPVYSDGSFSCESALAALIDKLCPGLDSGNILKDAETAMRVNTSWAVLLCQTMGSRLGLMSGTDLSRELLPAFNAALAEPRAEPEALSMSMFASREDYERAVKQRAPASPEREVRGMACSDHPDAPHGYDRNGSHNSDRYVCLCESWLASPLAVPAECPRCKGAGTVPALTWGRGPDDHEYDAICGVCDGTGVPPEVRKPHPLTDALVDRFAAALKDKLALAEMKYGYSDGWMRDDWMDECRAKLLQHIEKGDPRDVAAYCAFLWHHSESTKEKT